MDSTCRSEISWLSCWMWSGQCLVVSRPHIRVGNWIADSLNLKGGSTLLKLWSTTLVLPWPQTRWSPSRMRPFQCSSWVSLHLPVIPATHAYSEWSSGLCTRFVQRNHPSKIHLAFCSITLDDATPYCFQANQHGYSLESCSLWTRLMSFSSSC